MKTVTPCLWFDTEAEEAANFYVSVFRDGRIKSVTHYGNEGQEIHGKPAGSVLVVEFEIFGQAFMALNGGPQFKFDEAVSFQIPCETQDEVDYFWEKLTADGGQAGPCGWLKDKFGLSWQVVPTVLPKMLSDPDGARADRAMKALLQMEKLDIAALQRAYEAKAA
ncbi:MAG TPA: VOC family protein [Xanthobacteraceae bacterium]|nr:VOC family protein [Xanthobacteraceae bacterium]